MSPKKNVPSAKSKAANVLKAIKKTMNSPKKGKIKAASKLSGSMGGKPTAKTKLAKVPVQKNRAKPTKPRSKKKAKAGSGVVEAFKKTAKHLMGKGKKVRQEKLSSPSAKKGPTKERIKERIIEVQDGRPGKLKKVSQAPSETAPPKAEPSPGLKAKGKASRKETQKETRKEKGAAETVVVLAPNVGVVKATKTAKGGGKRKASSNRPEEAVCRDIGCDNLATSAGYCRLHYIKNWKKVKRKEKILSEKKLDRYIEELVSKYPDKYLEAIRQDLSSDREFLKVIRELEIDENIDEFDSEQDESAEVIGTIRKSGSDDDTADDY